MAKVKNAPDEVLDQPDVQSIAETDDTSKKEKKKKEKKDKKNDNKKSKKGLIVFLVLFSIIGLVVAGIVLNIGNVRDQYVIPALRNIPIVKNILPADQEALDEPSLPNEELAAQNKQLEEDIELKDSIITQLNDKIKEQNEEIDKLKEIEAWQAEFRAQKDEFDSLVATNSPINYKKYYESILPENAAELYKEVVQTTQNDKELNEYTAKFESMKAKNAAAILEELIATDMELVVLILKNIDSEQSASILAAMEAANAASVAKQLSP